MVKTGPDSTVDLKVPWAFALEAIRNQEDVCYMQIRFLELICLKVKQYPLPLLCANMMRLAF